MKWMEGRMSKKLRMLALNLRVWDTEVEIDDRNGEQSETGEAE
jgi:hypothetical protein